MKKIKLLTVLCLSLFLMSCKLTTDSAGVWFGTAEDQDGNVQEALMYIDEEGSIFMTLRNGLFVTANGYYDDKRGKTSFYALATTNFESPDFFSTTDARIELLGRLKDGTGKVAVLHNRKKLFTLTLQENDDPVATLDQYAGNWLVNPDDPTSTDIWSIDSQGMLSGSDQFGCNLSGAITPSTSFNLANIDLTIDSCPFAGVYNGAMSLVVEVETGRMGIFYIWGNDDFIFVNGLVKI